jgi:hypothetical protein
MRDDLPAALGTFLARLVIEPDKIAVTAAVF